MGPGAQDITLVTRMSSPHDISYLFPTTHPLAPILMIDRRPIPIPPPRPLRLGWMTWASTTWSQFEVLNDTNEIVRRGHITRVGDTYPIIFHRHSYTLLRERLRRAYALESIMEKLRDRLSLFNLATESSASHL